MPWTTHASALPRVALTSSMMYTFIPLSDADACCLFPCITSLHRVKISLACVLLFPPGDTAFVPLYRRLSGLALPWSSAKPLPSSALRVRANDPPGKKSFCVMYTAGIYLLAREGSNAAAAAKLKALLQALERQEPRNPALWLRLAQPYARLAGIPLAVA